MGSGRREGFSLPPHSLTNEYGSPSSRTARSNTDFCARNGSGDVNRNARPAYARHAAKARNASADVRTTTNATDGRHASNVSTNVTARDAPKNARTVTNGRHVADVPARNVTETSHAWKNDIYARNASKS